MRILVADSYEKLSAVAAGIVRDAVQGRPDLVLGLPTGRTPMGMYAEMVRMHRVGLLDLSGVTTFNLDEYYPMDPGDPRSFRVFMRRHLFDLVNVLPERVRIPDGSDPDPARACARYEAELREAGGLDLVILGIGRNGHIGFNEPGTGFDTRTRLVELSEDTIRANFGEDTDGAPRLALSMGIATIMESRNVLLLASGSDKSSIVREALFGPVRTAVPASILQIHPSTTVVMDLDAAAACGAEFEKRGVSTRA